MNHRIFSSLLTLACVCVPLHADVEVTIENVHPEGGFFFTPFWVALHNGGFDSHNGGTLASGWPGITELAEEGDTAPISKAFSLSPAGQAGGVQETVLAISGPDDAPVLDPGESVTITFDEGEASVNRYFSYGSMIIPSNDLFVANGNPLGHEVFDADGLFVGPIVIEIFANETDDSGTEVNDAFGGAAFSANGGSGIDKKQLIRAFFTSDDDQPYLDSFIGSETATGQIITKSFGPEDLIARITITAFCAADLDGSETVDCEDLATVIKNWGTDGAGAAVAAPFDVVDVEDLVTLVLNWGSCK